MSSTSEVSLYVDYLSQPSRACALVCRLHQLPVREVQILIGKGQTRSPDYLSKNPLGKVPLLEDGDFRLAESAAIMTYLITKFRSQVPEHWYPTCCPKARAQVDSALHWYHGNVRAGCARLVFNKVIASVLGKPADEAVAQEGLTLTKAALEQLEAVWLRAGQQPFMCGNSISCADLLVCCEIEQLTLLDQDKHGVTIQKLLAPHPHVRAWMARVATACAPHYEPVHAVLRRMAAKQQAPAAKM